MPKSRSAVEMYVSDNIIVPMFFGGDYLSGGAMGNVTKAATSVCILLRLNVLYDFTI